MPASSALQGIPLPSDDDLSNVPYALAQMMLAMEARLVLRFTSATARDAAVTSPTAGTLAYLVDADSWTYYNGSAWEPWLTSGWTLLPLGSTVQALYSNARPAYRLENGDTVRLTGSVQKITGNLSNVTTLGTLPAGYRPPHTQYRVVGMGAVSGVVDYYARVSLAPDGTIAMDDAASRTFGPWVDLGGITFSTVGKS